MSIQDTRKTRNPGIKELLKRNEFRVLSKFSLSPFSRRGRSSRGWCTVHCRCAVVVTMFELSKSISVSRLALESGPSNSFPSPLSVSLDIVVSFGSWFATPLGVDLVSAPCSAWPGGNRRRGGVDEPRHRARREGVGGWGKGGGTHRQTDKQTNTQTDTSIP